ncbi:MAG: hypothetical protein AVDCRST_MAG89-2227, partial [uncultured Gemmatimonadetes bacterium]
DQEERGSAGRTRGGGAHPARAAGVGRGCGRGVAYARRKAAPADGGEHPRAPL